MKARVNRIPESNISNNLIKERIVDICIKKNISKNVANVFCKLFDYMMNKKMCGCCHAFCSVLYVALSELKETPVLCIGECQKGNEKPYDHSWIMLNDKIVDIAIYLPMTRICNSISGPIIMNIDAVTMNSKEVLYGINTGLPMSEETETVMNLSFIEYMNGFPFEANGLWSVLEKIMPEDYIIDISQLRLKYENVNRFFIR